MEDKNRREKDPRRDRKRGGKESSTGRFGRSEEDRRDDSNEANEEMWSAMNWNYGP